MMSETEQLKQVHEVMGWLKSEMARAYTPPYPIRDSREHYEFMRQAEKQTRHIRDQLVRLQTDFIWPMAYIPVPQHPEQIDE